MLKKSITYTDPMTDEEVTEEFYFHLNKAELVELNLSKSGGLEEYMRRITNAENGGEIVTVIRQVIGMSYGVRPETGRGFLKTKQLREQFESSEAYSELFMELVSNPDLTAEFLNAVIPKDLAEAVKQVEVQQTTKLEEVKRKVDARQHPSDHAAKPAGPLAEERANMAEDNARRHPEADPTAVEVVGDAERNVFEGKQVRYLNKVEVRAMDDAVLKAGLADGSFRIEQD